MSYCYTDYNSISKFLNRLLGIEVTLQNAFFSYFMSTLSAVIMQAKRNGRWDMGILGKCTRILRYIFLPFRCQIFFVYAFNDCLVDL